MKITRRGALLSPLVAMAVPFAAANAPERRDAWNPKLSENLPDLTPASLRWLKQLGCKHVVFQGTDSVDQDQKGYWSTADIVRIRKSCDDAGLVLEWMSPAEGYVETQWFNVTTHASALAPDIGDLDHSVKIRFFADPTAGKTRLAAEVVTTYAVDPSRPQREMERMAPEGHPGREVLTQILNRLKQRFPGADTTRTPR